MYNYSITIFSLKHYVTDLFSIVLISTVSTTLSLDNVTFLVHHAKRKIYLFY